MLKKSTPSLKARALGEPDKKKRVNSKVKGNKNELEVAKALSKWTGVTFRRTPMSGAIHVPLDWLAGDVFCTDKDFFFPFSVEAKHYANITDGLVLKWWKQACADADRVDKHPFLIYRWNGMQAGEWKVMLPSMGIYPYAMYHFEMMPSIKDGVNPMKIDSTDLFDIPYEKFVKIFQ